MKKLLKTFVITIVTSLPLLAPVLAPPIVAYAASGIQNDVCTGSSLTFTGTNCDTTTSGAQGSLNRIVKLIVNLFSVVVGIIAVIFIIIGGIKYVTSGGEANNITAAKNTIMYAIVGLVVVALAQLIVRFVLGRVTGDLTESST